MNKIEKILFPIMMDFYLFIIIAVYQPPGFFVLKNFFLPLMLINTLIYFIYYFIFINKRFSGIPTFLFVKYVLLLMVYFYVK